MWENMWASSSIITNGKKKWHRFFPLQMLYVSSVLGLYFPYDFCLYSGMPALVLFGLKFIPAAIALLIGVIVTVGVYVTRYVQLSGYVMWQLVYLSRLHAWSGIELVMAVSVYGGESGFSFSCSTLHYFMTVWLSSNVPCCQVSIQRKNE